MPWATPALHQLAPDVIMMMTTLPDVLPRVVATAVGPLTPVSEATRTTGG